MSKLPISLEREPLVDALFEVRLKAYTPLSVTLPGILMRDLDLDSQPEQLPVANIPAPVRRHDPNLRYSPILRLKWDNYFIAIGDQCIGISCDLRKPYPKWPNFKAAILKVIGCMAQAKVSSNIERYSLKYVNLIPAESYSDQISKINMDLRLGGEEIKDSHVNVQVHLKSGDDMHIVSVATGASGRIGHSPVSGVIVDVDSIRLLTDKSFSSLAEELTSNLETLKQSNKKKFFDSLTDTAISEMGPSYE